MGGGGSYSKKEAIDIVWSAVDLATVTIKNQFYHDTEAMREEIARGKATLANSPNRQTGRGPTMFDAKRMPYPSRFQAAYEFSRRQGQRRSLAQMRDNADVQALHRQRWRVADILNLEGDHPNGRNGRKQHTGYQGQIGPYGQ